MIPTGALGQGVRIGIYVPMDDENHLHWEIFIRDPSQPGLATGLLQGQSPGSTALPRTTGWYGRFQIEQRLENDYMIDREAQKSWQSYTGILNGRIQDCAVTETMGRIYDRTNERLGTTDQFIIRVRRKMIAMAKALRERGEVPYAVDHPEVYRQRSGEIVLPRSVDWWEAYQEIRQTAGGWMDTQPVAATTT